MNLPFNIRSVAALSLVIFVSCGDDQEAVVPELQPISAPRNPYKVDAKAPERFPRHADPSRRFRYVPGSSWAELRATQFRTLNFAFGPDGVGECYLSEIAGYVDGGLGNINRWRQQMGLSPITPEELEALPRKSFAGQEAVFVKLDGNFQGMGESEARSDYRMLGMLMTRGCEAYSVKMTGPRSLLEWEESEFLAFCETLTIEPDPDAKPYAEMKVGPFEILRPCDWDYYVPESDDVVRRPLGFTFGPNKEGRVELGIIEGGSPKQVINGWLESRNREPMTDEGIAALPEQVLLNSLGGTLIGKLLEIENGETTFVGVVGQLGLEGHSAITISATLQGPHALVEKEKIMFRIFTESFRLGPVSSPDVP